MISLQNIQVEVDAGYLYAILAENESDPNIAEVFRQMSIIEQGHAEAFMAKNNLPLSLLPNPSRRAKTLNFIGKTIGYDYILGVLLDTEKSVSNAVIGARKKTKSEASISDTAHVAILRNILNSNSTISGSSLARFEKRHRSVGGNALRAAVLGGNDGLVSNFSLIMGIAGATSGRDEVLLAGMQGCLQEHYLWHWENGFQSKALRNCMKTKCNLKWMNWKQIRKAKKKNWL